MSEASDFVVFGRAEAERTEAAVRSVEGAGVDLTGRKGRTHFAPKAVRYAKLTAVAPCDDKFTGEPCEPDGTLINAAGAVQFELSTANPTGGPAVGIKQLAVNSTVKYLPTETDKGIILNPYKVVLAGYIDQDAAVTDLSRIEFEFDDFIITVDGGDCSDDSVAQIAWRGFYAYDCGDTDRIGPFKAIETAAGIKASAGSNMGNTDTLLLQLDRADFDGGDHIEFPAADEGLYCSFGIHWKGMFWKTCGGIGSPTLVKSMETGPGIALAGSAPGVLSLDITEGNGIDITTAACVYTIAVKTADQTVVTGVTTADVDVVVSGTCEDGSVVLTTQTIKQFVSMTTATVKVVVP